MKKYWFILLVLFLCLTAFLPPVSAGSPSWMQVNDDGFGDPHNYQIPSLAQFNGYLYAGSWHAIGLGEENPTLAAQIWRSPDGSSWEMVDEREAVNGAAALIAFKGYLYAGSWSADTGGKIWRSQDGQNWDYVMADGFGGGYGIARLAVYDGALYAGTWGDGIEIWRTINGTEWQPVVEDGMGDVYNTGAIASALFDGSLYWGVANHSSGAQLWRIDESGAEAVMTGGFGDPANAVISSLAQFKGQLYAGVWDQGAIHLYRSPNGDDWVDLGAVVAPSSGPQSALEANGGRLYLVAGNAEQGLEVWRTANGLRWQQVGFAGFGDPDNSGSFFDNATAVFDGCLYVATNNFATGGEVWRFLPGGCK